MRLGTGHVILNQMENEKQRNLGGRPRLSPEERRENRFEVKLTEEERRELDRLSAQRREPAAAVIRAALHAMARSGSPRG